LGKPWCKMGEEVRMILPIYTMEITDPTPVSPLFEGKVCNFYVGYVSIYYNTNNGL